MIDALHVVACIPARGGSKSVPRKNLHNLGGRPLLAWPIETAFAAAEIDRVIVSTDNAEIEAFAIAQGAEVHKRPASLASDTALVIDTLRHLLDELISSGRAADVIVLLEPTSPFRKHGLVSRCIRRLAAEDLDSIATFSPAAINPERTWKIENNVPRPFIDKAVPWRPRQQLTPAFQLNGAVYAFRANRLPADGPSILFGKMGAELVRTEDVIDIDDERDFDLANAILRSSQRS